MYKDPKPPKTPKGKAYTEDAATVLFDQINQQTAALQSQLDASDKLNSATQHVLSSNSKLLTSSLKRSSPLTRNRSFPVQMKSSGV